jgi:hypothetical protein
MGSHRCSRVSKARYLRSMNTPSSTTFGGFDLLYEPEADANYRHFSLGRHAFLAALKVLNIGRGDVVLIPAFICRDLLAATYAVGAEVLWYAVDEQLTPVSLPFDPKIKAVLSVNYFGFPQSLKVFRDYCDQSGAAFIEDNAHGFLSRDERGSLLGSRGDLGLLSLHKTFPLPDGAVLICNLGQLLGRLPPALPCIQTSVSLGFVLKSFLGRIQNSTGLNLRTGAERLTRLFRQLRTGHALPTSSPQSELEIPGVPAIRCKSLTQIRRIDLPSEALRRRRLYAEFHDQLKGLGVRPVFAHLPDGVVPYGYAFRANRKQGLAAAKMAQKCGLDCGTWPDLPSAVIGTAPVHYRDVWWVNFLC